MTAVKDQSCTIPKKFPPRIDTFAFPDSGIICCGSFLLESKNILSIPVCIYMFNLLNIIPHCWARKDIQLCPFIEFDTPGYLEILLWVAVASNPKTSHLLVNAFFQGPILVVQMFSFSQWPVLYQKVVSNGCLNHWKWQLNAKTATNNHNYNHKVYLTTFFWDKKCLFAILT